MFGHDNQDDNKQQLYHPAEHAAAADDQVSNQGDGQVGPAPDTADTSAAALVTAPAAAHTPPPAVTDNLLDIKQEALQALTPLVGQLDQTPEEQFRTTMMMIQASDNHDLVQVAYQAAKKISNEKERAQALLDIVNEINYFTQHAQA